MMKAGWWWLLVGLLLGGGPLGAADEDEPADGKTMDVKLFLERVRHPPLRDSWLIMKGVAKHQKRGQATQRLPLEVRASFTPALSLMQVLFNQHELFNVGQDFNEGIEGTTVEQLRTAPAGVLSLADVGIRPSDISLGFLYWEFAAERPTERLKDFTCRVLDLQHPPTKERVRMWVSTKFFFPFQVQWFKDGADKPYRELEFMAPKKVGDDLYLIKEVRIGNQEDGWRTDLVFDDYQLEDVTPEKPVPKDLWLPAVEPAPAPPAPEPPPAAPPAPAAPAPAVPAPEPAK